MSVWMIGVDTGGTFTDLVAFNSATGEARVAKVASVPADPSQAVLAALEELFGQGIMPSDVAFLAHGTTVATNALLEGKGARTGLLVTRGFRGIYEARGASQPTGADLVDPFYRKPGMLVPQRLCEEVTERIDHRGEVVTPLDEEDVRGAVGRLAAKGVEAIAVCTLFSFANPGHERRISEIARDVAPDIRVSISSDVLPVIREYARLSTTVVDAYVGPAVGTYLDRLGAGLAARGVTTPQRFVMQSSGGLVPMATGARFASQLLLSGPAAGLIAGAALGKAVGEPNVVTLDMGGTSTDIGVVAGGRVRESAAGVLAGQDVAQPMLKVRTLGAGGGTLAWIGKDGLLKVGPKSAGAMPGPAAYGRGGSEPTVTDANLVLGALGSEALAGGLQLDRAAARAAIEAVGKPLGLDAIAAAEGILRIVNNRMAVDLRLALQAEGQDPRRFALMAFGGAGGLHAAEIARMVGIPRVIIPTRPGLNCAMGLLQTAVRHQYLRSRMGALSSFPLEAIAETFAGLESRAAADAREEGFAPERVRLARFVEMRYRQQGYQLPVPCPQPFVDADRAALKRAFDDLHRQTYGQAAEGEDAEIVTFRLEAEITVPTLRLPELPQGDGRWQRARIGEAQLWDLATHRFETAAVLDRALLAAGDIVPGPAIVNQLDATTVVPAGRTMRVDRLGVLVIEA
jgi:N-methylhydantoinase A